MQLTHHHYHLLSINFPSQDILFLYYREEPIAFIVTNKLYYDKAALRNRSLKQYFNTLVPSDATPHPLATEDFFKKHQQLFQRMNIS